MRETDILSAYSGAVITRFPADRQMGLISLNFLLEIWVSPRMDPRPQKLVRGRPSIWVWSLRMMKWPIETQGAKIALGLKPIKQLL